MSTNPNTVKSQDDLPTTNDGKRSSDVLLSTIEELERTKKQLEIAVEQLKDTYIICFRNKDSLLRTPEHNIISGIERDCAISLQQIEELNK